MILYHVFLSLSRYCFLFGACRFESQVDILQISTGKPQNSRTVTPAAYHIKSSIKAIVFWKMGIASRGAVLKILMYQGASMCVVLLSNVLEKELFRRSLL